ncbi:hypothetical protein [Streptomyces sp. NPDC012508]|uniref:hypothetical protein n=1 Tax=Streptomyces sp. NPDC012508 TaxID=3364837 RepID=UPI003675A5C7
MSDSTETRQPAQTPHREPARISTIAHWAVTGLLCTAVLAQVLYDQPALRETAAAVGGVGGMVFAAVALVRRR